MGLLKTFKIPEMKDEFLRYYERNSNELFIIKNNKHRGIEIKSIDEINFTINNFFIQQYVSNPYLIDGKLVQFPFFEVKI